VLITLSVDGRWHIDSGGVGGAGATPSANTDPDDDFVRAIFNQHQHRAKGGARALGPDAAARLAELLQARGFVVELAPSPWQLSAAVPSQAALARALISGWRDAALEQRPQARTRIDSWHQRRQNALAQAARTQGRLNITLGHLDLLALPPPAALTPTHDPSPPSANSPHRR
jgi:hypothetical protein